MKPNPLTNLQGIVAAIPCGREDMPALAVSIPKLLRLGFDVTLVTEKGDEIGKPELGNFGAGVSVYREGPATLSEATTKTLGDTIDPAWLAEHLARGGTRKVLLTDVELNDGWWWG